MFGLGPDDLLVVLVIILVLFGSKKLPELSKGIAESIRELRKGFSDDLSKKDAAPPKNDDTAPRHEES